MEKLTPHIRKLIGKLDQWRMCMSHSDSFVGEPEGLFKATIHELARAVDPIYPEAKSANPFPGVMIYTSEHSEGQSAASLVLKWRASASRTHAVDAADVWLEVADELQNALEKPLTKQAA